MFSVQNMDVWDRKKAVQRYLKINVYFNYLMMAILGSVYVEVLSDADCNRLKGVMENLTVSIAY